MTTATQINYNHLANRHTLLGAKEALPHIFEGRRPKSFLDVGCGLGTWVRAALDHSITDVCGMDGIAIDHEHLLFPLALFLQQDLTQWWELGRQFDMVLSLEVAEHLAPEFAATLIESLTAHSDLVVFSAACPGQIGQHHVNCQWPEYWQSLFNAKGYVCNDSIRWKIWNIETIEPWYRQNMFMASRAADRAGHEPRIRPVIHPQMRAIGALDASQDEWKREIALIESGKQPVKWYFTTPIKACAKKLKRKISSVVTSPW
jgi:hypothetical protein